MEVQESLSTTEASQNHHPWDLGGLVSHGWMVGEMHPLCSCRHQSLCDDPNKDHSYTSEPDSVLCDMAISNIGKVGMALVPPPPPNIPLPAGAENMLMSPTYADPTTVPAPMTAEELGFAWPSDRGIFSPSAIPTWLREGVSTCFNLARWLIPTVSNEKFFCFVLFCPFFGF